MSWVTTTFTTVQYDYIDQPGWDAGARTIASLSADGGYQFLVGQATGIVCGLNAIDESASYLEIDHGFFIEDTRFRVIEQGIAKTAFASYTKDQVFKIIRLLGVVQYYLDDGLVYTSETTSEGQVFLDCSLYSYLDSIIDVAIIDYSVDQGGLAQIQISVLPFIAQGTTEIESYSFVELSPLIANGSVPDVNTIEVEVSPLIALGVVNDLNFINIEVLPLTVLAESTSLIPDFNTIQIDLRPLQVYGLQYDPDPATIDIELSPLIALGDTEGTLHRIQSSLSHLQVELYLGLQNYLSTQWPLFTATITQRPLALETTPNEIIWRSVHYQRHVTEYHSPFVYETHTDSWSSEGQVLHNVHYTSYESVSTVGSFALHTAFYQSTTEVSLGTSGYQEHIAFYQSVEELIGAVNQQLHEVFYQSTTEAVVSSDRYKIHEVFYQSSSGSIGVQTQSVSYESSITVSMLADARIHVVSWESVQNIWNAHEITWKSIVANYQSHKTSWMQQPQNYKGHETRYCSISTTPLLFNGLIYVRV